MIARVGRSARSCLYMLKMQTYEDNKRAFFILVRGRQMSPGF